jgi:glyoxylate/hydroxypyruvate reductase A
MSSFAFILPTWPIDVWASAMKEAAPTLDIRSWPEKLGRVEDISYAAAWLPPPNVLGDLKNLKVIFSLGAGVDAILSDLTLPKNIPVVRVNDPDLTNRMSEYIIMHVLLHHRQQRRIDANQQAKIWDSFPTHAAKHMTVGVMGLGVLGQDAARKLAMMGFNVVGWSRSQKQLDTVTCYAGAAGLPEFLAGTDILVCLLPATSETDGIINAGLIRQLSRKGPFGAPILINAGRGRQHVEADLLKCLDSGELYAATLDVFSKEPLPVDSPFWSHPRVTLTPHAAADSEPLTICSYIANQIARHEQGQPLQNLVDRAKGY